MHTTTKKKHPFLIIHSSLLRSVFVGTDRKRRRRAVGGVVGAFTGRAMAIDFRTRRKRGRKRDEKGERKGRKRGRNSDE